MSNASEGFYSVLQVENPKGAYRGQNEIMLVSTNTAPNTNSTIPNVPVIVFVKYNTAMIAATTKRTMRSKFPMFFFITFDL